MQRNDMRHDRPDVEYIDLDELDPEVSECSIHVRLFDDEKANTDPPAWDGYPKVEDYKLINRRTGSIRICTRVRYSSGLSVKFKEKLDRSTALMRALDVLIKDTTETLSRFDELLTDPKT